MLLSLHVSSEVSFLGTIAPMQSPVDQFRALAGQLQLELELPVDPFHKGNNALSATCTEQFQVCCAFVRATDPKWTKRRTQRAAILDVSLLFVKLSSIPPI